MNILQDILGLLKRRKVKQPEDKDYIASAAYETPKEILKPNPLMRAALINLKDLKNWIANSIIKSGSKSLGQGWARYDDNQYTELNPLTLTDGVTTILPNNASGVVDNHLNSTVQFYNGDTKKIQAENEGDVYIQTIVFKASATNANQTHLHIQLGSTGSTNYSRVSAEIEFPKGNGVAHDEHIILQFYTDTDFVNNGNQWLIRADTGGGTVNIWNIIYFIQRTYKA